MSIEVLDKDISVLMEHLEARGIKVDTLLMDHLCKINKRMHEEKTNTLDSKHRHPKEHIPPRPTPPKNLEA